VYKEKEETREEEKKERSLKEKALVNFRLEQTT
jgi:hypothetical protein